ncbi:hypothetical protein DFS34DRAFT_621876 [Phlyctochytrium arcticum]|nr:hypothetical protein DFS34DRAFT_621876 [Phlyctochytrium arcticum]
MTTRNVTQVRIDELCMRSMGITLMSVNIIAYFMLFKNKTSAVSRLILLMLVSYLIGVVNQSVPRFQFYPNPNDVIYVGVGCFLLASEVFNWVLYLRFNMIVPFKRNLRQAALIWLICESCCIFGIYVYWCYATAISDWNGRVRASTIYTYLSIIQAITAFMLAGYFAVYYYFPLLGGWAALKSGRAFRHFRLWSGGFLSMFVESALHLGYAALFEISKDYYLAGTIVCNAVRYSLFLSFIFATRDANANRTAINPSTGAGTGNGKDASQAGGDKNATVDRRANVPKTTITTTDVEDDAMMKV